MEANFAPRLLRRWIEQRAELAVDVPQRAVVSQQSGVNFGEAFEDGVVGRRGFALFHERPHDIHAHGDSLPEFNTLAAIIAPCSVKASGGYLACWPRFKITDCDLKIARPAVVTAPCVFNAANSSAVN